MVVSTEDGEKKTPHELWHGHPPDLTHLCKWGSQVLYYSKPESKMESRVMDSTFVMYRKSTWQYYVIPQGSNSLHLTTNPEFWEREYGYLGEWKPPVPIATPLLPSQTGDDRVETTDTVYTPIQQTAKQMSQPQVGAHLPHLPPSVLSAIKGKGPMRWQPANPSLVPQSHASGTASSRPQSQNEAVLDPHMATLEQAPPKSQGETLEKAPPESHKGTQEEAPPDPIINHSTNSPLSTEPTTADSREPLGKPFSESPTTTGALYDEPHQSTHLQQNTEHLDDSLQQQHPHKCKAEGEEVGNPAQCIQVHLAQLVIANELYSFN